MDGKECGTWTAREDYQLLDAIEQFGYGNWEDVAKHVETRDAERNHAYLLYSHRKHYIKVYI